MRRQLISFAVASTLVAAVVACTGRDRASADSAKPTSPLYREAALAVPPATVPAAEPAIPAGASLAPLIDRLKPAVVAISTTTVTKLPRRGHPQLPDGFEYYFGMPPGGPGGSEDGPNQFRGGGLGSGFLLNAEGYILTNNHVVKDATEIKVKLHDEREFLAKVVGKDPLTDVALIKLNAPPRDLPTVVLGDSDAIRQGDFVLALGSPFGLSGTATMGIVSAKHRASVGSGSPYDDFLQTDAAINPGNSGGPLFNMRGEVIGINTAIISPGVGQGIGFAVPINLAKSLLPQLKGGKVVRGYVGVQLSELTPDLARAFGLKEGTRGALVQQVLPKTPAAKAGLEPGDVITTLDGKAVESSSALTRAVALVPPGTSATLGLLRQGSAKNVTLTVAQRPDDESTIGRDDGGEDDQAKGEAGKNPKLGVKLQPLTPELARQLRVEAESGVVVAEVVAGGPAESAGLQRGDLIVEVNRKAVSKPADVVAIVNKAKDGEMVLLRVRRGASAAFVAVPVGGRQ
jgi:serine protease Do